MLIKSLQGKVFEVDLSEVYIKPIYNNRSIKCYAVCSNEGNNEIILGEYTDKTVAKHMVRLLRLYENMSLQADMLQEVRLAEDLWLTASERLAKAARIFNGGVDNEGLHRK